MAVRPAIYLAYAWGYELTVYTAKILCLYTLNRAGLVSVINGRRSSSK